MKSNRIKKRIPPYNYGISQEDFKSEVSGLSIEPWDNVLCIASGGEVPLNLLTLKDLNITAVDSSIEQIYLTKFKLYAALALEPQDAAGLIGFTHMDPSTRKNLFKTIVAKMDIEERKFWEKNTYLIENGPINEARFEKYIKKVSWIGRSIIGKNKLLKLIELGNIKEQYNYFDKYLNTIRLRSIFKLAFHPKIYKKRGIASAGLTHSGERNIADFFFDRFRNFCCSTIANRNYYLQYIFFNKILLPQALPEYLQEDGIQQLKFNYNKITFRHTSYYQALKEMTNGQFNKFHLSNIGDWLPKDAFAKHLKIIAKKGAPNSRIITRYIHYCHPIPKDIESNLIPNYELGASLEQTDRFPFYNIIPIKLVR